MLSYKIKRKNFGGVVIPFLIGLGMVAVVLGILFVWGEKGNKKGKFQMPFRQEQGRLEEEGQITILPSQRGETESGMFLTIISPADGAKVSESRITLRGKTVAEAEVSVNEKDLVADAEGNFSTQISLEEGENFILVTAGNQKGFEEKEIVVYYEK